MTLEDDMNYAQYRKAQEESLGMQIEHSSNSMALQEAERGIVKDQLDLTEELERIEHLLRGHVLKYNKEGNRIWAEPDDNEMVVLSEYGIHLILNTITWYINKNTLLSNYDEATILTKMEDFSCDLADTIFMEYEKVFQYPSLEDCKKIFNERIEYKTKLRMFASEISNIQLDEKDEKEKIIALMEGQIEREIEKIKQQIIKSKLKRFLIIMRSVQDSVHSTYNRAYKGMERRTLREHIHISETSGNNLHQQQNKGFSPLSFMGRR